MTTPEATPDWAGVSAATGLVAMVDAISPVHTAQAERAPQPDDCLYRYEVSEIVVRELARLRRIETAARAVSELADADDDFEGAFLDHLVPHDTIAALRAALDEESQP